ncbi:hypothetical protein G6F37_001859 [Rhizopus arrhizus]|nr:hypothetical protein G6F38_009461 [Rhizopus arrhizus]KAG1162755.1 hypothetical protein G6F37_001859 [Rhizopus arrhizus]
MPWSQVVARKRISLMHAIFEYNIHNNQQDKAFHSKMWRTGSYPDPAIGHILKEGIVLIKEPFFIKTKEKHLASKGYLKELLKNRIVKQIAIAENRRIESFCDVGDTGDANLDDVDDIGAVEVDNIGEVYTTEVGEISAAGASSTIAIEEINNLDAVVGGSASMGKAIPRMAYGRRCDLIFRNYEDGHSVPIELGASEARAKSTGTTGTKLMKEGFYKLLRTPEDMLDHLLTQAKYDEKATSLRTVGFLYSGLACTMIDLDRPRTYISRVKGTVLPILMACWICCAIIKEMDQLYGIDLDNREGGPYRLCNFPISIGDVKYNADKKLLTFYAAVLVTPLRDNRYVPEKKNDIFVVNLAANGEKYKIDSDPINMHKSTDLESPLFPQGDASDYAISPDASQIASLAKVNTENNAWQNSAHIYTVSTTGKEAPAAINKDIPAALSSPRFTSSGLLLYF